MALASKPVARKISAIWGGRCAACGLRIPKDAEVMYTPEHRDVRGLVVKSAIRHLDGECGSEYTVRCIYAVSSKTLKMTAYDAADALEQAKKTCAKGRPVALPLSYQVYQGNVLVQSEVMV